MTQSIQTLIANLKTRNIEALYFDDVILAMENILKTIPIDSTVGIGNSQTLKKTDISKTLASRGNKVFDKTMAITDEEVTTIKKQALLADWFITSTNAVSLEGHLVNIDHSGNRVAAMLYGPEHVIVVVGTNKIVVSLDEAINRARNTAAPANARRAGLNPPCTLTGECIDCRSEERACKSLVIIEGQHIKDRMKVYIINESLGY